MAQLFYEARTQDSTPMPTPTLPLTPDHTFSSNWLQWWKRAAELGHASAAFWVGYFIHQAFLGEGDASLTPELMRDAGLEATLPLAHGYLCQAHEGGDKQASLYLSRLCRDESSPLYDLNVPRHLLHLPSFPLTLSFAASAHPVGGGGIGALPRGRSAL